LTKQNKIKAIARTYFLQSNSLDCHKITEEYYAGKVFFQSIWSNGKKMQNICFETKL